MASKAFLLWIWLNFMNLSNSEANYCCPPNVTIWETGKNCSDGSEVMLDCPNKMYFLDQNDPDDPFDIISENGSWLVFPYALDALRIPQNEFCLSKKNQSKELLALVCFGEIEFESLGWKFVLFGTLSVISACFLIITLAVYVILPELRDIQDKAMMSAVASLLASYIILAIQQLRKIELAPVDEKKGYDILCIPLAFIMYYAFLSAFFWLNLVAFNIWRLVWFKSFLIKEDVLFIILGIFGWGGPMCFLIVILCIQFMKIPHLHPPFIEERCWFKRDYETLAYFYGPISVLLVLNVIYLGLTYWKLWNEYHESNSSNLKSLKFKCLLYFKLFLVMGITWIFEIIAFFTAPDHEAWILTDILNSLQGVIIFFVFVVTRKRVRKLLAKKKPFGISFPKSWTAYEDEECEEVEINFPEELELSQSSKRIPSHAVS